MHQDEGAGSEGAASMLAKEGSPPAPARQDVVLALEGGGEGDGVSMGHAPQTSAIGAIMSCTHKRVCLLCYEPSVTQLVT